MFSCFNAQNEEEKMQREIISINLNQMNRGQRPENACQIEEKVRKLLRMNIFLVLLEDFVERVDESVSEIWCLDQGNDVTVGSSHWRAGYQLGLVSR